jgi:RimJ/RimL family protein N-acetyltransferase
MALQFDFDLPIVAGRTRVRRLAAGDLPEFTSYRADPDVGRYQGWSPLDSAAAGLFIAQMSQPSPLREGCWMQVAIADARTDALLGDIGIHPGVGFAEVELGFTLAARHQGQGLASEAVGAVARELFRQTPAQAIRGLTDARNQPSIALLERLGFQRVAEQQGVFRGEPCLEYVYLQRR